MSKPCGALFVSFVLIFKTVIFACALWEVFRVNVEQESCILGSVGPAGGKSPNHFVQRHSWPGFGNHGAARALVASVRVFA